MQKNLHGVFTYGKYFQKIDSACENTRLEIRGNQTSCTVQVQVMQPILMYSASRD